MHKSHQEDAPLTQQLLAGGPWKIEAFEMLGVFIEVAPEGRMIVGHTCIIIYIHMLYKFVLYLYAYVLYLVNNNIWIFIYGSALVFIYIYILLSND